MIYFLPVDWEAEALGYADIINFYFCLQKQNLRCLAELQKWYGSGWLFHTHAPKVAQTL